MLKQLCGLPAAVDVVRGFVAAEVEAMIVAVVFVTIKVVVLVELVLRQELFLDEEDRHHIMFSGCKRVTTFRYHTLDYGIRLYKRNRVK